MGIIKELNSQTIIIIGNAFNPSSFTEYFLIKNGFIKENELLPESLFSANVASIITERFNMIIVPDQIQFSSKNPKDVVYGVLMPLVNLIGDNVKYIAAGINFRWHLTDTDKTPQQLSKDLFFNEKVPLTKEFNDANSSFGIYMSKDFMDARLRVDCKHVKVVENKTGNTYNCVQVLLNFHHDFKEKDVKEEALSFLNNWSSFEQESQRILKERL